MSAVRFLLLPFVLVCVGQNVHGARIIHGEKAPRNSMQYMVSVQEAEGHVCGGFLISQEFVLTAAHCGKDELTHVILGTQNIKKNNYVKREIERTYIHPEFESKGLKNDIMLLKLAVKVYEGKSIQTISIPTPGATQKLVNQTCVVAGWGKINTWNQGVSVLRDVSVSVLDTGLCKKEWETLPPFVICAGGSETDKGFCQGDSGGPLVCNDVAVGIVSFNGDKACVYPHLPNVYTNISPYVPWINQILEENE